MTFGETLKKLIEDRAITQKKLASDLNIAPSTLGNYIRDLREPDFDTLKLFARYFEVSADYLLNYHTKVIESSREQELLQVFRLMDNSQQELFIEQGKVFLKHCKKEKEKFER